MDQNSVVDILKMMGQGSGMQDRTRLWSQMGGQGAYKGSQVQNDAMRKYLNQRSAPKTPPPGLFNTGFQPQMMPRNPASQFQPPTNAPQSRGKGDILRDMIQTVSQLAQQNPKDPMIGLYQQFIRSKIQEMSQQTEQMALPL